MFFRAVRKIRNGQELDINIASHKNRLFTDEHEKSLELFLKKSSQMFYGLTIEQCRKLFYDMAVTNEINVPESWHKNRTAGEDYYYLFMKRHPNLSLRTPEACSLARAVGFNKNTANMFFDNLEEAMSRHPSFMDGTRIFNCDEHGETTVHTPKKVVAERGTRQVSQVTSAERGTLVTICAFVNATGTFVPPAIIFPRKHFKKHMLRGAPAGTLGLASKSGWMDALCFLETLKHFVKCARVTRSNPAMLICDNHESHLQYDVLKYAKKKHITMVTIPPHASHKIQPLDVSDFGPLSTAYDRALLRWLTLNPGCPASIYEVAGFMGEAFDAGMTPMNIKAGFRATGIFPFNRNIFSEKDFMPSLVTDRPPAATPSPQSQVTL